MCCHLQDNNDTLADPPSLALVAGKVDIILILHEPLAHHAALFSLLLCASFPSRKTKFVFATLYCRIVILEAGIVTL